MTELRKRQALTRMKYDRVDLVAEGANAHAHILLAKNRAAAPKTLTVRKAMGQTRCNDCETVVAKNSQKCTSCGSSDLSKTTVQVTKKVTNPKKTPKNDDATNSTSNAGAYTFEDEQYDQDNGENGQALGDSVERSSMSKSNGWYEEEIHKDTGTSVDSVDNEKREAMVEGEDDDSDIEDLAETKPTSLKKPPNPGSGFINTATSSSDSTAATHKSRTELGKKKRLKKTAEKPGLNSYDLTDGGSQNVAESAEQMYRSESSPTVPAQTKLASTMSSANGPLRIGKARVKRQNREGLDPLNTNADAKGIYGKPGVKRNGVGTGHNKHTTKPRTSVAPPRNPLDKSRHMSPEDVQKGLVAVEAANLAVRLAKNLAAIHDKNRPDLYPAVVEDFLDVLNAGAQEWFAGSSITKSSSLGVQVENVAAEVYELLAKASPASEMSDEASEGVDPDKMDSVATNSMGKLKTTTRANENEKEQTVVGKKKLYKSVAQSGEDEFEVELDDVTKGRLDMLEELLEEREANKFIAKARELRGIPGYNEAKVAKQLRAAYETDPDMGAELEQMLAASANVVNDSAVLKQYGMTGAGSLGDDDMNAKVDRAYAAADDQIRKSGAEGVTREQAAVQYMKDHPGEFYQEAKHL